MCGVTSAIVISNVRRIPAVRPPRASVVVVILAPALLAAVVFWPKPKQEVKVRSYDTPAVSAALEAKGQNAKGEPAPGEGESRPRVSFAIRPGRCISRAGRPGAARRSPA